MTATLARTARAKAIAWARSMIAADALVLDLETLGKGHGAGICNVAVVAMDGTVVFDQLINPGRAIPLEASRIHRITLQMVADAPRFADIYGYLSSVFSDRTVCTYNVGFDGGSINAICREHGLPELARDWQCAMLAMADFVGERGRFGTFRWLKLGEAAEYFGIAANGAHRALADAELCRKVILALANSGEE